MIVLHIIYVAPVCSEATYRKLAEISGEKTAYEVQKYHRLFAEGLAAGTTVDVISAIQLSPNTRLHGTLNFPDDIESGVQYHYPRASSNRFLKKIYMFFGSLFRMLKLAQKDTVIITDCLSLAGGFAAVIASILCNKPVISVVTDLPDMFSGAKMLKWVGNLVIRRSWAYVVLTPAMQEYISAKFGNTGKKFVVIEGNADVSMRDKEPSLKMKSSRRICLYAGNISALYGLRELLEGFCMAELPDTDLYIYGAGDFVEEVEACSRTNPAVHYGGVLFSDQVVRAEQEAALLINPRPTKHEFVKYSFPSKTMEYMSTGTPVLMTELPSLPQEYKPYLMFIREETAQGVAQALKDAFAHSDEELFAFGGAAREFILRERNNTVQARKVLQMCESLRTQEKQK